jgi:hypothetical protein
MMKAQDFQITITVDATIHDAFKSINQVTKWWTENLEGSSHKLNDEFTVFFGDVHVSKQKVVEFIPDRRVVWLVTESRLNFIEDKQEWNDTQIIFDLEEGGGKTQIRFTHAGLVPAIECFNDCSSAWSEYIQGSLRSLVNTGKGQPTRKGVKV